jgi:hypothetical protein
VRRRATIGRKTAKARHRKSGETATRPASSPLADLQAEVGAVSDQLAEARKQQTATALAEPMTCAPSLDHRYGRLESPVNFAEKRDQMVGHGV